MHLHIYTGKSGILTSWWIGGKYVDDEERYYWLDDTAVDVNGWKDSVTRDQNGHMMYMKIEGKGWRWGAVPTSRSFTLHFICKLEVKQSV